MYYHEARGIRTLVHGDDYASTGAVSDLRWLRDRLEKKFEMKTTIVGHSNEADVVKEGKILNRIIRATSLGWEYECDQRHVEVLVEELGLRDAKSLSSPGVEGEKPIEVVESPPLGPEKASHFRALVARGNYIAVDRADAQYAVKELCRDMSAPTEESWIALIRLVKYFLGKPRAILEFHWQEEVTKIDVFSDANWAGCKKVRKSTSGGVVMYGRCCIKTWSKTQATIAQSSAESELLATVRGAAEGIGLISLGRDLGIEYLIRLHIDASAALGIIERRGVGRVRHLEVGSLWIQEQQLKKIIEMLKVPGLENPADLVTKHLNRERINVYVDLIWYRFESGRAITTGDLHMLCASS